MIKQSRDKKPGEIKKDIYCVGAIDWDRRLFDSLIPLPDGTSYNSYLIKGSQKTALIDTVDPTMHEVLLYNLDQLGIKKIDYVIFNHAEPDHSGAIAQVLAKYPEAKAVCTPKCRGMLIDRFMIPEEKFITVEDGYLSPGRKDAIFLRFLRLSPGHHRYVCNRRRAGL